MSDYFDQIGDWMHDAVARGAHLPWYSRVLRTRRLRLLAGVVAVAVVATPAVGAVTNWFGFGAPDRFPAQSPTVGIGRPLAGTAVLLPLRIADPRGGPPWGLRLVRTTRGDTCIQLGRVEDGELGSLGIDGAWDDDHLFHPFPNTSEGDDCGTTDAAGNGFVNVAYTGLLASANPTAGARGAQAKGCTPPSFALRPRSARAGRHRRGRMPTTAGTCPPDSGRIVFMGLLGPDATRITYQAPDGALRTERTASTDGAYLLVFPLRGRTCELYTQGPTGGYGPCGSTESIGGASPDPIGAVKAITYRNGSVCHLGRSMTLMKSLRAFIRRRRLLNSTHGRRTTPQERATIRRAVLEYLAARHISRASFRDAVTGDCPAVGYVAGKQKHLTSADVASRIRVRMLAPEYDEYRVDLIFTARQPVTSSSSWYEDYIINPRSCPSSAQGGEIEFGNVRGGTLINDRRLIGSCRGTYHGLIGYMQNSGAINQDAAGGGMPGQDGSIVVGRFSFQIR